MNPMTSFVLLAAAAVAGTFVIGAPAGAQTELSGPTVVPDRYEMSAGERVKLTLDGFRSRAVTMTFCGNDGRRGSADCDMRASQSREIDQSGNPTAAEMPVSAPPAPCPCIIRVSSQDSQEIAVASVVLIGHPVAEIVEASGFVQPLSVDIDAVGAPNGLGDRIRSSLGGPTTYEVTVRVQNLATYEVENLRTTAGYNRLRYDDERSIELDGPASIAPGETWEQTVDVELPSLTFGDTEWRIDVSGTGPPVNAADLTSQRPVLLFVVVIVLLADLAILIARFAVRRRRRRPPPDSSDNPFFDEPWSPDPADGGDSRRPMRELVG